MPSKNNYLHWWPQGCNHRHRRSMLRRPKPTRIKSGPRTEAAEAALLAGLHGTDAAPDTSARAPHASNGNGEEQAHFSAADVPAANRLTMHGRLGLLTEAELAAELHRAPVTLRRWRKNKTGPPWIPVGRDIYYRLAAVREWLHRSERDGWDKPANRRRGAAGH